MLVKNPHVVYLRKYRAAETFVCSTALTSSGKNCLEVIDQKESLHFHLWKQKQQQKRYNYSVPQFLYLSGEGLLNTLRGAAETRGVWRGHEEKVRAAGKHYVSCRAVNRGKHEVWGHFHGCAPQQEPGTMQLCAFPKTLAWPHLQPPRRARGWSLSDLCFVSKNGFRKRKHNSKWCCQTWQSLFSRFPVSTAQMQSTLWANNKLIVENLINIYLCQSKPFSPSCSRAPVVTGTSTFITSTPNPTTKELWTQWKHLCACCLVFPFQADFPVVLSRCTVIFRGITLLFFSLPVVSVLQLI